MISKYVQAGFALEPILIILLLVYLFLRYLLSKLFPTYFAPVFLPLRRRGSSLLPMIQSLALPLLLGFVIGVAIIVMTLLVPILGGQLTMSVPTGADVPDPQLPFGRMTTAGFALLIAQLALFEELAFRGVGILLPTLLLGFIVLTVAGRDMARSSPFVKALLLNGVFLSSMIFSLMHVGNPNAGSLALLNIFLAGVLIGLVFVTLRSLLAVWSLHFTWNFTLELVNLPVSGVDFATAWHPFVLSPKGGGVMTGGSFGPEGSIFLTVVLIAGSAYLARAFIRGGVSFYA